MGLLKLMQPCRAVAAAAMAIVLLQTPTGGSSPAGTSVGTLAFLPSGGASCSECASSQRVLNSRQTGSWWSRPVRLAKHFYNGASAAAADDSAVRLITPMPAAPRPPSPPRKKGSNFVTFQELDRMLSKTQGDARGMLGAIVSRLGGFTAPTLTNAIIRLSRAVTGQSGLPDPRLDEVLIRLEPWLPRLTSDQLCSLANALSRLRYQPSRSFVSTFSSSVSSHLEALGSKEVTTIIYFITRLYAIDEPATDAALEGLCTRASVLLPSFTPQDLAMMIAGLSRLTSSSSSSSFRPSESFMRAFCAVVEEKLEHFAPADVAMTLAGLAKVKSAPPELSLLAAMHESVLQQYQSYRSWELAMAVEGLQGLRVTPDPLLFNAIHRVAADLPVSEQAPVTASAMASGGDSNAAHSLNRLITALPFDSDPESLLVFSAQYLQAMGPINIATLLNRLSRVRISTPADRRRLLQDERFIDLLARVEAQTFEFQPQGLANTLHALAKLGYIASPLFLAQLTEATHRQLSAFKTQELAMAVFGLSKLGRPFRPAPSFLKAVCKILERNIVAGRFSMQHLALTSSGLARSVDGDGFRCPEGLVQCYWSSMEQNLGRYHSEWQVELAVKSILRLGGPLPSEGWRAAMVQAGYRSLIELVDQFQVGEPKAAAWREQEGHDAEMPAH